jgi:hypothetical protein
MYDSNQFQGKYSQITHIVDNDTMKHLWFSIAAAFIVSIFTAVVNFDPQEAAALENSITQENNPTQINSNSPSMTITQSSIQSEDCSRECGNANQNSEQNAMQVNDVEQTNNFNSDADSTMTTRS